jgi:hypothetical protein
VLQFHGVERAAVGVDAHQVLLRRGDFEHGEGGGKV